MQQFTTYNLFISWSTLYTAYCLNSKYIGNQFQKPAQTDSCSEHKLRMTVVTGSFNTVIFATIHLIFLSEKEHAQLQAREDSNMYDK